MTLSNLRLLLPMTLLSLWAGVSGAQTVIGIVTDGPETRSRTSLPISDLEREI